MKNTFAAAIAGAGVWRRHIEGHGNRLILIIPDYEEEIIAALPHAVQDYFIRKNIANSDVLVVFHEQRIRRELEDRMPFVQFDVLSEKEMEQLTSYACLSMKHLGLPRDRNVKIIAPSKLFAGQLQRIRSSGLFPISALITSIILIGE